MFLSTTVNKVDRKGRISVPAAFRAAVAGLSCPGIVLYPSPKDDSLQGCGIDRIEDLAERLEQLEPLSDEYQTLTTLFGDAVQLAFDTEGRIQLPEDLRDYAGIGEAAAFVGRGKTFEIWNPEALAPVREAARHRIRHGSLTIPGRAAAAAVPAAQVQTLPIGTAAPGAAEGAS